jgi:hypothetical protein
MSGSQLKALAKHQLPMPSCLVLGRLDLGDVSSTLKIRDEINTKNNDESSHPAFQRCPICRELFVNVVDGTPIIDLFKQTESEIIQSQWTDWAFMVGDRRGLLNTRN